jgi:hypothetical protein
MELRAFRISVLVVALVTVGFVAGVARTRQIMIDTANHLVAHPTNSFTKCLTESWEQTGELGDWRRGRRWVLREEEGERR